MKQNINLQSFLFFLLILFLTSLLFAQAGQLDTTFGQSGIVTTRINDVGNNSQLKSTKIQSDGKIVAAGYSYNTKDTILVLMRYNQNGLLDNSFGLGGITELKINGWSGYANSLALQDDGKIVVVGASGPNKAKYFTVARFNENGSLDYSFGTYGFVTTSFDNVINGEANSVVIQNDGKIVVVGGTYSLLGNWTNFAMVRYNPDGSLDNTFGNNGFITTKIPRSTSVSFAVAIQTDQKIIVAGGSRVDNIDNMTIVRYNPNGTLDPDFGSGGIIVLSSISSSDIFSLLVRDDGKIIAGGKSNTASIADFTLVRLNSNGYLDQTFGNSGIVTTDIGGSVDIIYSLELQNDDKILAGGYSYNLGKARDVFALARYNQNGSLDSTFGIEGKLSYPIGNSEDAVLSAIAIQNDGKIIAVGYSYFSTTGKDLKCIVVRYDSNGESDNTFGISGIVSTQYGSSNNAANSALMQNDGKIVAAGYSWNKSDYDFAIIRYNFNGDLDNTFGVNGIVTTPIGASDAKANSIAIQNDNKIVAAGYYFNGSNTDFALVRYKTNGFIDNSFGINGIVKTIIGSSDSEIKSIAIQGEDKIIAVGYSFDGVKYGFAMTRYTQTGALDIEFGNKGIVNTFLDSLGSGASTVVIQKDLKIVTVGYSYNKFAIARYNPNGNLDSTFGTGGIVTTQIGSVYDYANSAALQEDGKIVVTGYSNNGLDYDFAIVRYNVNGDLDNTFGKNGIVVTPIGNSDEFANSAAIQIDGKILIAGYSNTENSIDFATLRYNTNGDLDDTFGDNGIVASSIGGSYGSYANSVVLQSDGNAAVVGTSYSEFNVSAFSLVRYITNPLTNVNDEQLSSIPTTFNLEQNYPNPFNPTTTIKYSVPNIEKLHATYVQIKVYDVLGREVETLVNEFKNPGSYEFEFNASQLSSGIYFYELASGDYHLTKKMILLK